MKVSKTPLPGVLVIEPDVYGDSRGFFMETFQVGKYAANGISGPFVQDNFSKSCQGTLRGLHAQLRHPQDKLVQIISGVIWDVAVDIRPSSPTYKKWFGVTLSSEKPSQIYVPVGYAHGFCVLSDVAEVAYKCTDVYDPEHELHILWNDPDLAIQWPIKNPVLSKKDAQGVTLRQVECELVKLSHS